MIKKKPEKLTINVSTEVKEQFHDLYNGSDMNSMGQLLQHLMDYYTSPENFKEVEKIVEVEKIIEKKIPVNISDDQVIIELNPIHQYFFDLLASEPDNMIKFNKQIEKLINGKDVWWDDALKSKYKDVYIPFIMENLDDISVKKHNIGANLINTMMYIYITQHGRISIDFPINIDNKLTKFIDSINKTEEMEAKDE